YRPGIRNSSGNRQLNARQMQTLLNSLRNKSGFLEMRFDESGFLTLGDRTRISGGSVIARKLIIDVIDGRKVFELENYDNSPYIAFGRLGEATIFQLTPTNEKIVAQPVRIDFSDFTQLRGGADVLAAFDVGLIVLHELCHGALNLHDADGDTIRPGECEEYINRIRRELGLPERAHYSPRLIPMLEGRKSTVRAELLFVGKDNGSERARTKRFYLTWDAEKVAVLN